jgi:hypothetical protein
VDTDVAGDDGAAEVVPECGNGVVEGDEECDDGDANSDTEPDACRTDCSEHRCGDGVVDTDVVMARDSYEPFALVVEW